MKSLQGGFYFHPSDEDLPPGTPGWKSHSAGVPLGRAILVLLESRQ